MGPVTSVKTLVSIQYLRAIAALMVVFHHARNPKVGLYNPLVDFHAGAHGVSIFFVISGYIMYAAARKEGVGEFGWKRISRIVPLYWLAIFVVFCTHYSFDLSQLSRVNLVKSLLFIPFHNPEQGGEIWPLLAPGWTLNYEMFFYVVFAVGLFLRKLVPVLFGVMVPLVIAGWMFPSENALWSTYTGPLLLEFLAGVSIAIAFHRGRLHGAGWMLPIGLVLLLTSDISPLPHLVRVSIPAVMIVCGGVASDVKGRVPRLPVLKLLGDASYSIYLVHTLVLRPCWLFVESTALTGLAQFLTLVLLSMIVSVAAGLAAHVWIERPMLRLFRKMRGTDRAQPTPIITKPSEVA